MRQPAPVPGLGPSSDRLTHMPLQRELVARLHCQQRVCAGQRVVSCRVQDAIWSICNQRKQGLAGEPQRSPGTQAEQRQDLPLKQLTWEVQQQDLQPERRSQQLICDGFGFRRATPSVRTC